MNTASCPSLIVGVIVTYAVAAHPSLMDESVSQIALLGLGIAIAMLALAKRKIEGE